MMMLEHPHVVKLEEVLESPSTVFFVMELCGGGSLYELMDNTVCIYRITNNSFSGDVRADCKIFLRSNHKCDRVLSFPRNLSS